MKNLVHKILRKIKFILYQQHLRGKYEIIVNNQKFHIPIIQKIGHGNRDILEQEHWMLDVLLELNSLSPKLFIDVGVNIGQTLLKLKSCNKLINYIGFEPNPSCVFYTNELIKINNFERCKIIPSGISDTTQMSELHFYYDDDVDSSASIIKKFRNNIHHISFVPVFHPDEIKALNELAEISILKIDVEGAELEVLKGFEKLISRDKPIILIEVLPVYNTNNTFRLERQTQIEHIIKHQEYIIHKIKKNNQSGFEKLQVLDEFGIQNNWKDSDYLLVHRSKISKLKKHTTLYKNNR